MRGERAKAWLLAAAIASGAGVGASAGHAQSCLDGASSVEKANASKADYDFTTPGHAVDATGVTWKDIAGHAIGLDGNQPICFHSGHVDGPYPEDSVYECTPEHCPGGVCPDPCWAYHISAGVSVQSTGSSVIEDVQVNDYGDGISQEESANRADMEIRRAYLHDLHDDAVENDWVASVRVFDSLLERVDMAFASRQRSGSSIDARDKLFEVRNSLVQLHRFTNQYKEKPGHGGFWKWGHDGMDPRFAITDNVFVAETPGDGLIFPLVDQVVECRNNKLLWAGTQAAWQDELDGDNDSDGLDSRGRMEALSYCYTVIVKPDGQSQADFLAQHWDPLVAAWKATHLAAGGTPSSTETPTPTPKPSPTPTPTPSPTPAPSATPTPTPSPTPTPTPAPTPTPTPAPDAPMPDAPPQEPILLP